MITQNDTGTRLGANMLRRSRSDESPVTAEDISHWVRAAKFAIYAQMHATAREYLNKATLLASLHESDDCAAEIARLASELRSWPDGVCITA
jgi:hypothetical protein